MTTILSGPHPLHVETTGDDRRPALLLINPLGTNLAIWDPMMEELAASYFVVRFDLRGHGGSTSDEPLDYHLEDLVGDALVVLDALEIPRTHVFGASLGGLVALKLAGDHPDRVDRLVVASTSSHLGPTSWWERTIRAVEENGIEGVLDHLQGIFFSTACQDSAPSICETSRTMLQETGDVAYLAGARAILGAKVDQAASRIRAPTLLIYGENDPVLRFSPAEDLLGLIPDAEAVMVGGTAHRVTVEQATMLAPVVEQFLADPDGR